MGLFGGEPEVNNADLNCSPQNDYISERTVSKIDDIIDSGEKIHYLAQEAGGGVDVEGSGAGKSLFGDDRSRKMGTIGMVRTAATHKRVVIKIPQLLGSDERSVPYRNITSVDLDLGAMYKRLTLQTAGQTYHIDIGGLSKDTSRDMAKFVRDKIAEAHNDSESTGSPDPTEKIEKLQELRQKGAISEEEFEDKKEDLLDEI